MISQQTRHKHSTDKPATATPNFRNYCTMNCSHTISTTPVISFGNDSFSCRIRCKLSHEDNSLCKVCVVQAQVLAVFHCRANCRSSLNESTARLCCMHKCDWSASWFACVVAHLRVNFGCVSYIFGCERLAAD